MSMICNCFIQILPTFTLVAIGTLFSNEAEVVFLSADCWDAFTAQLLASVVNELLYGCNVNGSLN